MAAGAGDNDIGIAGTAWRVSIVPLKISRTTKRGAIALPNDQILDAYAYVEQLGIPIATTNIGAVFVSKQADTEGAKLKKRGVIKGIPQGRFEKGVLRGIQAFQKLPWFDPELGPASRTLYTFPAGNETLDIGQEEVFSVPGGWLEAVIPQQTITAGHAIRTVKNGVQMTHNADTSSYGSAVEIWAPGTWFLIPWDAKDPMNLPPAERGGGTSFAAPTVAGVAALRLSRHPESTPSDLHDRLIDTATPTIRVTVEGEVRETDRPLVNACEAVAEPTEMCTR